MKNKIISITLICIILLTSCQGSSNSALVEDEAMNDPIMNSTSKNEQMTNDIAVSDYEESDSFSSNSLTNDITGLIVMEYVGSSGDSKGSLTVYCVDPYSGSSKIINTFPELANTEADYSDIWIDFSTGGFI